MSEDTFSYLPAEEPVEQTPVVQSPEPTPIIQGRKPVSNTTFTWDLKSPWVMIAIAVVVVAALILIWYFYKSESPLQGFAARRSSRGSQHFAARRIASKPTELISPMESMCGGADQMCPCNGNETMVGKNDPHELTPEDLTRVLMGQ